jgi:hypothetical protein
MSKLEPLEQKIFKKRDKHKKSRTDSAMRDLEDKLLLHVGRKFE